MADIMLTFRSDVPSQRRDAILEDVSGWPGVQAAAPINANGPEAFKRFSFARVDDGRLGKIAEALKEMPEVEAAEIAPLRGMP